jgi:cellulose synthase/poly-beta-1,6-N-acetylglucosamine synthase-like glycosyltransferase
MTWLILIAILPYFFIILSIYRNLRRIIPFVKVGNPHVKVSVLVACRNEEKNLPCLLNNLYSQDYNPDLFEVIIIDDNSDDKTLNIASAFKEIKNFRVLSNTGRGKKSALGTGIEEASGELIITTDADCRIGEKWLSEICAFYSSNKADMIIAPVQFEDKSGFPGRFTDLEFLSLQGITAGTALSGNPVMCNGANLAFTKEAYKRNSGNLHNELLSGDDIFFLHSLKKETKSKILWLSSSDGAVTTKQPNTLCSFINQRARWISKAGSYEDRFSLALSIVTFVTILTNISLLITGIFIHKILLIYLASVIMKSIPDYLILSDIAGRYNKRHLLKWFIPSQAVYPFYVTVVLCRACFRGNSWK